MRLRSILVPLFVFVAGLAWGQRAEAKTKIAILGLESDPGADAAAADATANLARWLTQGLRAHAQRMPAKFEVPVNTNKDLAEMKLVSDCLDEKVECMVQVGKDLGVEKVLYGRVVKSKNGWTLTLRYLNVATKSLEGRPVERVITPGDANEDGVGKIASSAFGELTGVRAGGSIEIQANVDAGVVFVDGVEKGDVSGRAASLDDLPEGTYKIAIVTEGKQRWEQDVVVRAGEPTLVVAELEPAGIGGGGDDGGGGGGGGRPGGGARAMFWTSLVVTGAGVAGFTITGLKVREYEDQKIEAIIGSNGAFTAGTNDDACSKAAAEGYKPVQDACDKGKTMATYTNVLVGVTAVAAVAAGFFYYKGYMAAEAPRARDNAKAKGKRRAKVSKPRDIVVTPQVYGSGGAGLGATITF